MTEEQEEQIGEVQEVFGFCACGSPKNNVKYICRGLELIQEIQGKGPHEVKDWSTFYDEWRSKCNTHFGNRFAADFFFYWADKNELTEHGSCIPGWLTAKGSELLTHVNEILNDTETEEK